MSRRPKRSLALTAGAALGLTPALLGLSSPAFAADAAPASGGTATLCSIQNLLGWEKERNLCFDITTSLPSVAADGETVSLTLTLTPNESTVAPGAGGEVDTRPQAPLVFNILAGGGFEVTEVSTSLTSTVADASGNGVSVTLVEAVPSTIEVVGTVSGAAGDPFGFSFEMNDVRGCSTEFAEWDHESSESTGPVVPYPTGEGTWRLVAGEAGPLCPGGLIAEPEEPASPKSPSEAADESQTQPQRPARVETGV